MSFAIAAAGTGGHVYPGLAVGEALVDLGVDQDEILYIGGDRLEAGVYPAAGFPFLSVEVRGLVRRPDLANLGVPTVVARASARIRAELAERKVGAVLGLGGYVTVPAGLAGRWAGVPVAVAEQNAVAGLANRFVARWAKRVFGSFPHTDGLTEAEWVGNPIRRSLADFDRALKRPQAMELWGLDPSVPVLGIFGGSLGAATINRAVAEMLTGWDGPAMQVVHLAGTGRAEMSESAEVSAHRWVVLDFCADMENFYAVCDLVVARAGGSVAELTATATPAVLIPGGFGSRGHQAANAAALERVGAAAVVPESELGRLGDAVTALISDPSLLDTMRNAARTLARPEAASVIAAAMMGLASR